MILSPLDLVIFHSPSKLAKQISLGRSPNITAKQYNSLQANRVGVVSSGTQRLTGRNFFVALVNVYKSDRLDNNVGSRLILGVGIYACNRVNDLDAVYNVAE